VPHEREPHHTALIPLDQLAERPDRALELLRVRRAKTMRRELADLIEGACAYGEDTIIDELARLIHDGVDLGWRR
jgi:hypothetical protein